MLADIGAGSRSSSLKRSTPAPERRPIAFTVDGHSHRADLYLPREPALAAMVLVPGAALAGKDDSRLVAFAETMARARFEVLVPDLPRLRALQVASADAARIADAAAFLADRNPARPLGMTAISVAVGLAVLALFEADTDSRVDFLITVGGYHDLVAAITFFTTGHYRAHAGEPWRFRQPNAYGKWVFVLSNADRLTDPRDRQALHSMALAKLAALDADVSAEFAELSPDGRAVHALITNTDPDHVPDLLAALPSAVREEIEALDLKRRNLADLDVRFLLIHGHDDPIIPETESVALARAVGGERADLHLVDSLHHVDLQPPDVGDFLDLLAAVYEVLAWRDRARGAD